MRKAGAPKELPPPLEMECLNALWRLGEANVREVREQLSPRRKLAYTTVMTLLERLARRGRVARKKQGRAFRYVPAASREEMQRLAVAELVGLYFDGSLENLAAYLKDGSGGPAAGVGASGSRLDASLL